MLYFVLDDLKRKGQYMAVRSHHTRYLQINIRAGVV